MTTAEMIALCAQRLTALRQPLTPSQQIAVSSIHDMIDKASRALADGREVAADKWADTADGAMSVLELWVREVQG